MKRLFSFIAQDGRRFAIEIGSAIVLASVAWAVGYFLNHQALQGCQDERTALLKEAKTAEAARLAVVYGNQLKAKDSTLLKQANENLELRKKISLDSADRLTLLEAMGAINARYKTGN